MNFLSNLVQKLFHLVHLKNKGQFLHDLAAFKVVNWRKDAQTHEVWAQSIGFHLFSSISKKRWGFQDKSTGSRTDKRLKTEGFYVATVCRFILETSPFFGNG